jgi:hypothetical protein
MGVLRAINLVEFLIYFTCRPPVEIRTVGIFNRYETVRVPACIKLNTLLTKRPHRKSIILLSTVIRIKQINLYLALDMDLLSARSYAMIILLVTHAHAGQTEEKQLELLSENYVSGIIFSLFNWYFVVLLTSPIRSKCKKCLKSKPPNWKSWRLRVQQHESVINSMQRDKSIEMDYKSAGIINATLRQGTSRIPRSCADLKNIIRLTKHNQCKLQYNLRKKQKTIGIMWCIKYRWKRV